MKVYTSEELSQVDGTSSSAILVAVNGKVYDVSESKKWSRGRHMNRHQAGRDLSTDITAAPHGLDVLERFNVVGTYEASRKSPDAGLKATISSWLDRHPFFRRHPHPAVVHLPVGVSAALILFEVAALLTASPATEWAAVLCLIVTVLSLPAAMITGYFTWWMNYDAISSRTIRWKRRLAWIALAVGLFATIWRGTGLENPVQITDLHVMIYAAAVLALTVMVAVIGFLGGTLTFPYEKGQS
jgi:predicted heme/steroid binding protein/uncharacterized membrane protein